MTNIVNFFGKVFVNILRQILWIFLQIENLLKTCAKIVVKSFPELIWDYNFPYKGAKNLEWADENKFRKLESNPCILSTTEGPAEPEKR